MKTQEQTHLTTNSDRITNTLYSTKVTATGGRHGEIRSEDGLLDMRLALPRQLGGRGDATNPEQLFAGGYAACFENALLRVSREAGLRFADEDVEVTAEVGLSRNDSGGFVLSAALAVTVTGVDQKKAEDLVESAHKICVFTTPITNPAWKLKPSWYPVAKEDKTINPDLERMYAERAHSHKVEIEGASHAVYISHPKEVAALIEDAAGQARVAGSH
jgi:osmotically inducible protein OsmC